MGIKDSDSGYESRAFHQEDQLQVWLCSALYSQDSFNELLKCGLSQLDPLLRQKRRPDVDRRFRLTYGMYIIKDHLKGQIFSW